MTSYLCGLRTDAPKQKCQGNFSIKYEGTETRLEQAGSRWFVYTPVSEIIIAYNRHDTATKPNLPNQTVFLTVPEGTTVHIVDIILHHISQDRYNTEIEFWMHYQAQLYN